MPGFQVQKKTAIEAASEVFP